MGAGLEQPAGVRYDAGPERRGIASRLGRAGVVAAALLVLALGARIGLAIHDQHAPLQRDAVDYSLIGRSIAAGDGYPPAKTAGGGASALRPPGYPAFLAAVYKVSGGRLMAVRLAQAALGVVTVALIGILAMLLFGRAAGLAALAIAAIYPGFLLMDDAIMSETLYVPLTLGAVVAACMHRRSPHRWRWAVVAGLIFGLSLLTRQNGVLLLVPLILLVWSKPGADRRQRLATAALVVLVAGLVVLPWTVRNAVKLDAFVPVATQSGLVLAGTYNDQSRNDPDLPGAWRPPNAVPRYADVFRDKSLNEAGVDAELRSRALSYISDHPGYLVAVGWHNVWRLMHLGGSRYERDQAGDRNVTQGEETVGRFGFYVLALMAIAGAATGLARRAPWYLWLVPVLLATVLLGQGMIRYRDPIDPFLVLLAACGVASLAVRGHATSGAAPAPPAASGRAP